MSDHEIIVIGAGPAGSSCAAICADAGKDVLLLDSSRFPRDKVCGDCVNPSAWPVLNRLGLADRIRRLPSSFPSKVRFSAASGGSSEIPFPSRCREEPEFVVRRRDLDALLAERAVEAGVIFRDATPLANVQRVSDHWEITTAKGNKHQAKVLVAADGRNSLTARSLGMHGPMRRGGRIGIQTHVPHPAGYDGALEMRIYRHGYGGLADLGTGIANLCLVANDGEMKDLRFEAEQHYLLDGTQVWRSITPISRNHARVIARNGVFLCGDAARVVEPFTGEGISYALKCGALLAEVLVDNGKSSTSNLKSMVRTYRARHRKLYQRGLMVNRLTRFLSEHPSVAHYLAPVVLNYPGVLKLLTSKVVVK